MRDSGSRDPGSNPGGAIPVYCLIYFFLFLRCHHAVEFNAGPGGFEPPTFGSETRRAVQATPRAQRRLYKHRSIYISMQSRGQTSVEYLLLVGGVVLVAIVAGYYVVSSATSIYHDINSSESWSATTSGTGSSSSSAATTNNPPAISSFTATPSSGTTATLFTLSCSATDDVNLHAIQISEGTTVLKVCNVSGTSATCTYSSTFSAGTHTFTCVATDSSGQISAPSSTSISVSTPTIFFYYQPSNPTFKDTIQFVPVVSGAPSNCSWDFGDGNVYADPSCTAVYHKYSTYGYYTVTLTAYYGTSSSSLKDTINVRGRPPAVSLSVDPKIGNTSTEFDINCDSTDDVNIDTIRIYVDSGLQKVCAVNAISGTCEYQTTLGAGSSGTATHVISCEVNNIFGETNSASAKVYVSYGPVPV